MVDTAPGESLAPPAPSRPASRALVAVFCLTAFWSSALLFMVQPLVARQLLPRLGGAASVWNTAMVFFQAALLAGYLVAHLTSRMAPGRRRTVTQIGVVAVGVAMLPVSVPAAWVPPTGGQSLWTITTLAAVVGLPFFALSTLSPTLQSWFAGTDHPRAADPYFLYAAGNIGSAVGLLAYPVVVEPELGLVDQSRAWSVAYVVLIGLLVASAVMARRHRDGLAGPGAGAPGAPGSEAVGGTAVISGRRRVRWVALAAVPSALMLAVTRHLTTDVASIPLLWVIPLLVYLVTFVVAFGRPAGAPSDRLLRWTMLASVPVVATLGGLVGSIPVNLGVHLLGFATMALLCHTLLAADRPAPVHLTEYFFWISLGGVVGGASVALVAPVVFDRVTEYPLLVVAVLVVLASVRFSRPHVVPRAVQVGAVVAAVALGGLLVAAGTDDRATLVADLVAIGGGLLFVLARQPRVFAVGMCLLVAVPVAIDLRPVLHRSRSFFGVSAVELRDGTHQFVHGTTIHGAQRVEPERSDEPLLYYRHSGGLGRMMTTVTSGDRRLSVAVVGLGTGTVASYGRVGDRIDFFEIDPDVVDIARDERLFTYLADSAADVGVTVVDGRVGMTADTEERDVVVLDAFSSDAIPTHLLTAEAMAVYRGRLADDGVVLVHISNRHFDLRAAVARAGASAGFDAAVLEADGSRWMALTPPGVRPEVRRELEDWGRIAAGDDTPLWTDDYTNVLATLDLGG